MDDQEVPPYCSTYCEHNAHRYCECEACVYIRAEVGVVHELGCEWAEPG